MTTHFIVKENIAQNRVDVILSMLKSWDINAKVEKVETPTTSISALPFSTSLWADYDVDDKLLRAKAWGAHKRNAQ